MEVRIQFKNKTKKQLKHLFNVERELGKAGVSFDTGYNVNEKIRDWEFDYSLKGAEVNPSLGSQKVKK